MKSMNVSREDIINVFADTKTKTINHLGIIVAAITELNLVEVVDRIIPVSKKAGAKVTHGQRLVAMILTGLGFLNCRLYRVAENMADFDIESLFGPDVKAEYFTDDTLSRCLDAIFDYGIQKFMTEITLEVQKKRNIISPIIRLDTTTLPVYGQYENHENSEVNKPEYGYSKNKRHDLKQLVLLLTIDCVTQMPIYLATLSGNEPDQKSLIKYSLQVKQLLSQIDDAPETTLIADAAAYAVFVKELRDKSSWISRVPATNKLAKSYLQKDDNDVVWQNAGNGYKFYSEEVEYNGVVQRYVIVFSQKSHLLQSASLDRRILEEREEVEKMLKKFQKKKFGCEKDAQNFIDEVNKKTKYHKFKNIEYIKTFRKKIKEGKTEVLYVNINCTIITDIEKIEKSRAKKGKFILATNQLDINKLSDETILQEYKKQSKIERSFAIIKKDSLRMNKLFLKKPERLQALMLVMTVSLMVYSYIEYFIRQKLEENNESIEDAQNKKKPKTQPTAEFIFKLFFGIVSSVYRGPSFVVRTVYNVKEKIEKIIRYLGAKAMIIYGILPQG